MVHSIALKVSYVMNSWVLSIRDQVMTTESDRSPTPFDQVHHDFVFGQIWARPGLSRRDRRWITLTSVGAADATQPIDDHVYAALNSGDISIDEMLEFVLHFAVYNGWPKASHLEGVIRKQWASLQQERGEEPDAFTLYDNVELGSNDWDERIARGMDKFSEVNLIDAPPPISPYIHAGILNFVFGHVWQRPGLSRRDRRFITVASVAVCDSTIPMQSHIGSALESGDITKPEMDEIALHFSVYSGFAKGQALQDTADEAWQRIGTARSGTS